MLSGNANTSSFDADGQDLDIWNNSNATGTMSQSLLLSGITGVTYNRPAGNVTFILDFSNGNPLPATGLSFLVGGAGLNLVKIVGSPYNDMMTVSASSITIRLSSFGTASTHLHRRKLNRL